ncbi:class IIb bacteriocin, lactobin A/cerein 7B family [Erythrobacter sp. SCSIO 43205]|uniref:hypothetical protein n=1 Tax=Erythrobacter sp. SCSIO 43205 TaxID=2779361 RepID=UPI001CA8DBF7|nr:hypothetical protein [Erythrobacter sp. SCSIO 43205]UAB78578.1 class IIb bacteriocin, lactobin A/cerein 7B family [Erythrobacter sp. SCSIO 43205]
MNNENIIELNIDEIENVAGGPLPVAAYYAIIAASGFVTGGAVGYGMLMIAENMAHP